MNGVGSGWEKDGIGKTPARLALTTARGLGRAGAILVVVILVTTVWGVFTRYVLRDPAVWTLPVSSYALLWCAFLAGAQTLLAGRHVRVDFLLLALRPSWRWWAELGAHVGSVVFLTVFCWQVTRLWARSLHGGYHDTSMLHVPLSLAQAVMPLGSGLMLVCAVVLLLRHWRARTSG